MNINIEVNAVLVWHPAEAQRERILWIDNRRLEVVSIQLDNAHALPIQRPYREIERALANGQVQVEAANTQVSIQRLETDIPANHRQRRDAAWTLIEPLVTQHLDALFEPEQRGRLLKARMHETGCRKKVLYKYLRRYWQGGQTKNALLPDYDRCGGPGKVHQAGTAKRGRPSANATGMTQGVNVDETVRAKFRQGIALFYETPQSRPLTEAYQRTLEAFFHEGYEVRQGVRVPILPPSDQLPSFGQFRYWYAQEQNLTHRLVARQGQHRFNTRHREVLGNSTHMATGPGSIYQIDATIGDIYLVSALDRRRLIGKPIIYVVIDTFSRMVVGLSVSLEGPSWVGAMLALENVAVDKVTFCQQHDIVIGPEQWPAQHLPEMLLADRGELEGYQADNLVNSLNIRLANTPPYRADWKGIVERHFRLTNDRCIHWLPGASHPYTERGDRDDRYDARLTLDEVRQLLIYCVLYHNQHQRMDWYPLDEDQIVDGVAPYPLDLWQWGIVNRAGHLRSVPTEQVRLQVLPQAEASVTRRGILFQGLHYTCALAQQEQWFIQARRRWKIPVCYDPRFTGTIYLRLDNGQRVEPCTLLDTDRTFRDYNWYETLDYHACQKQGSQAARGQAQATQAEFHAQMDTVVKAAVRKTEQALGQATHPQVQGIRQARQQERETARQANAWQLQATSDSAVVPSDTVGYVAPPNPLEQLRQVRKEKLSHEG